MSDERSTPTTDAATRPEVTGSATAGTQSAPDPAATPRSGATPTTLGSGDFAASDAAGKPPTEGFEKVAQEVRQGAERAREEIRRGAEATKEKASDVYGKASAKATDAYDRASSAASDAYARASESARHTAEEARENLREGYERLREDSAGWSRDLEGYVRHNPGRSVMFAAAFGFVVGMLFKGDDE